MALLTNINGKFSVSDAGAVTFNNAFTFPTTDGAANYVLQTNGSGQLAWALNGNGDISGSGTANTVTKFTGAKNIGNGPITFSGNNSTFLGTITVSGTGISTINGDLVLQPTKKLYLDGGNDTYITEVSANLIGFNTGGNQSLSIGVNESTFAGNVEIRSGNKLILQRPNNGVATEISTDSTGAMILNSINDEGFFFNNNGNNAFKLDPINANFTGTVTAPTFLGNLQGGHTTGSISSGVTAVTQANAIDNTTVATTAYVNNKIGTIPAGLVFQGTWNASTNTPTLTSGSGTTGHFYIVSVAGSTNLDGITDWQVGDWAVFIEQGASDQWEKIDNSSVLDGIGTGGSFAGWSGSGTSVTLGNAPVTFSGNNSTFAGDVIITTGKELIIGSQTAAESPLGITIRDNKGDVPVGIVIHNENTGTGADAAIAFETQGAMDFSIGLDRSDSSKFVMSRAGVLGTNNVFTIDNVTATFTGSVTSNAVPAFNVGTIGAIGNTANDLNIYSTTAGHNGLRMHANGILPTDNSGAIIDNDADLGFPTYRFKDLYLGGSIISNGSATFEINAAGNNVISTFKNVNTTAGNRSAIKVEQFVSAVGSFSAFLGSTIDGKVFLSNDSITANHLLIDTSGNVGIGTASPR